MKRFILTVFALGCLLLSTGARRRFVPPIPNSVSFPLDIFARANETPLAGNYDSGPGTWDNVNLASNVVIGVGGTCGARLKSSAMAAQNNQTATVKVGVAVTLGYGPAVRLQGTGDAACYFVYVTAPTAVQIWENNPDGTYAQLGGDFTVSAIANGDLIGLSASGTTTTTLTLYINGVSQGTRTDSSGTVTGGQPGFLLNGVNFIAGFSASSP